MSIIYTPIGVVRSPFTEPGGMPIQPTAEASATGVAEVFPQYSAGLQDLAGFSHVILLYHFHRANRADLVVTPFLDSTPHGVFATRAPSRPNPIGMSVVELLGVDGNRLRLGNVDVLDGTPLLDIKPYVPEFDAPADVRTGWLAGSRRDLRSATSDGRFAGA